MPSASDLRAAIDVVWGHSCADLVVKGATVLLASGEWLRRDVAVAGQRIAAVGEGLVVAGAQTLDATGKFLVPCYVEPHAHALGPQSLGPYVGFALTRGIGCLVTDDSYAYGLVPAESYGRLLDTAGRLPLVARWSLRPDPSGRRLSIADAKALLTRQDVIQVGEIMTRGVLDPVADDVAELLATARRAGRRLEGHNPGASARTLGVAAAAGTTADHEAITGAEVRERLRAGMWAFLRHNALRPDVPGIVGQLLASPKASFERLAFTLDGTTPAWVAANGMVDAAITAAIGAGLATAEAYGSACWRPATYARLDHEVGLIAPGRYASFNLLDDVEAPRPELVFSQGRQVARDGELLVEVPDVPWDELDVTPWSRRPAGPAETIYALHNDDPVLHLESQAMLRVGRGQVDGGPLACVTIDPGLETYTRGRIWGFPSGVTAIASTLTPERMMVVVGGDPAAMKSTVDRLFAVGGGLAYHDGERVHALALPVGGVISSAPFVELARFWVEFERHLSALGHRLPDPATTLLFTANSALPGVRFTEHGMIESRTRQVIRAPVPAPWD